MTMVVNPYIFAAPGEYDPYWPNVVALLHFDGADGATSIVDQTGKSWTRTGDAQISTAQSKFGGASAVFDGAGDRFNSPTNSDFTLGTGASTLELWVRPSNVSGSYRAIVSDNRYPSSGGWRIYQNGADLQIWYQNTILQHSAVGVLSANVWVHVAWVRTTTTSYLFVNGVLSSSSSANFINLVGNAVLVGAADSFSFNGYVDELRITKWVARYTGDFSVANAPFPNS